MKLTNEQAKQVIAALYDEVLHNEEDRKHEYIEFDENLLTWALNEMDNFTDWDEYLKR